MDGNPGARVSWSSSAPEVAYVTPDGVLRAVGAGPVFLTATAGDARRQFPTSVVGQLMIMLPPQQGPLFAGDVFVVEARLLGGASLRDLPMRWSVVGTGTIQVQPITTCNPMCREEARAVVWSVAPGPAVITFQYGAAATTSQVVVAEPAQGVSEAVLAAERFSVSRSGRYEYYPLLRLRETAGTSAAVVTEINFRLEGIGVYGEVPGWGVMKRVPAGGTAEMISEDFYGEWEFSIGGDLPADTVSVTVRYRDKAGRPGSLVARTAVTVEP